MSSEFLWRANVTVKLALGFTHTHREDKHGAAILCWLTGCTRTAQDQDSDTERTHYEQTHDVLYNQNDNVEEQKEEQKEKHNNQWLYISTRRSTVYYRNLAGHILHSHFMGRKKKSDLYFRDNLTAVLLNFRFVFWLWCLQLHLL